MFGSPALIDRVGRYGEKNGIALPSLRRVISAGAPVPASALARFTKMLSPDAEIFTPYGATESLPVTSIGSKEILGETAALTDSGKGVCVGRPAGEIRAKIVAITDDPIAEWSADMELPPNRIGEIVVQGPVVTREYFQRPEATRNSKIQEVSTEKFYHRMGDVGYFDETGRLWFCGRKSQRVRRSDGDLFSTPFEAIFNTHPHVVRSALVGITRGGEQEPVICIELNPEGKHGKRSTLLAELRTLAERHPHTQIIRNFLVHPRFPVDIRHNAKINREQLALWAQKKVT
jgi:acyl-CoA synthetase (AMP-forming)/AMP-acid ligase II